jgi:hypothetical protein
MRATEHVPTIRAYSLAIRAMSTYMSHNRKPSRTVIPGTRGRVRWKSDPNWHRGDILETPPQHLL